MRPILLTALLATACAAEPADDDAPPDDGPVTIVGTWRWLPNIFDVQLPVEERFVLRLHADETFEYTAPEPRDGDTYLLYGTNPQRLRLVWSDGGFEEMDVVLRADQLLLTAMYPDGPVDGAVGTWRGSTTVDGEAGYFSYQIEGDGTFRRFGGDPAFNSAGTWREVGLAMEFTLSNGGVFNADRLDEDGIGLLTERIADD